MEHAESLYDACIRMYINKYKFFAWLCILGYVIIETDSLKKNFLKNVNRKIAKYVVRGDKKWHGRHRQESVVPTTARDLSMRWYSDSLASLPERRFVLLTLTNLWPTQLHTYRKRDLRTRRTHTRTKKMLP